MVGSINELGVEFSRQEIRGLQYYQPLLRLRAHLQQHQSLASAMRENNAQYLKGELAAVVLLLEADLLKVDEVDLALDAGLLQRHVSPGIDRQSIRIS